MVDRHRDRRFVLHAKSFNLVIEILMVDRYLEKQG